MWVARLPESGRSGWEGLLSKVPFRMICNLSLLRTCALPFSGASRTYVTLEIVGMGGECETNHS
jgi:hypothetical protein